MIFDLFAGPGGWSEGLRALGHDDIGLEWDEWACLTRAAAGHLTIRADVAAYPVEHIAGPVTGLIASPPCQQFSVAGSREGLHFIPALRESIEAARWDDRCHPDPRVWLVLEVGRWVDALRPEWIACEQVRAVAPLWRSYARLFQSWGYSTWTGILNAADYGVPQDRRRAFLIASRTHQVGKPEPTHSRDAWPDLFSDFKPWVSMAEALGWGMTDHPYPTIATSRVSGGPDREKVGGESTRIFLYRERDEGRWVLYTQCDWQPNGSHQTHKTDQSAPTLSALSEPQWYFKRPATTIAGNHRVFPPGSHMANDGRDNSKAVGRSDTPIRLSVRDALILQSFREDYPVAGSKTKQFHQIGNAVPPLLAQHVLAEAIGVPALTGGMACTSTS